jgi:hypothetical protein
VITLVVLLLVAKVFDRLPAVLVDLRLIETMRPALRHVLLALEEVLEMAAPLLAMLAIAQGRALPRPSRTG